ncbi:SDR family NAD(P)-dependent oxidoreductase [Pseudomonas sp. N040]|uniref:SDR family NAD(P)-dependent oxidoreductase n=1 Tax=Pseudomonas sp. N040 TaxID=2785325 RepID=UPI0018A2803B|nr:SDR family NAD(P)-dependent oxidoreductase [Pseudomonas sp. N040]MBF7730483.1 SDR family NAD(P)-dependent oxidoreductase [Pseudomonas sp. N040]MBW7014126.1 SDR family NAD(P)-dependent oxidoreductase [Pseudomonas sp. N040]
MNKTIVITGASAGIGRALAEACFTRGYHLGLTGRRMEALKSLRGELLARQPQSQQRIELCSLDVDDSDSVGPTLHELFERLGGVDIVVANAGINDFSKVGRGDFAKERHILQTNVIGAIATVNAAAEHLLARGAGQIVGISSLASLKAIPTQAAYCASKAAFSMYLDGTRMELGPKGIAVTTILPGFVATGIMPNVEKYPFAVSAGQAAREMLDLIEKRRARGIVPAWPWKYLRPLFGLIPDGLWKKML